MRSQNIKCNSSGKVGSISCLLLLLLTFLAVNPFTSLSAFAEEEGEDYELETYASTPSTVTISFSPSSASGSVTPVDSSTGDKAKVDVKATINVKNSGGYKVYVGSSSSQLKNGSNVIDSVTSATTYANLPINRWGYSFQEGTTAKDSYTAMPATLRSTALYSNTSTNIADETKTFMLSFAARIGSDKPAGTYSNSVTMSVVSSPLEITNKFGINTMQEMTSSICSGVASGTSDQLKDTRDGKFYWVSKLADGKCWMTQNLDLDLSTSKKLTSADSDVPAAGWTPGFNTAEAATSGTVNSGSNIETRSWSLGDYRITNPNTSSDCGLEKNLAASCLAQFTFFTTPTSQNGDTNAHYILGNHYQWNTATAGTGGTIESGTASSSICPKGWRLPTGAEDGEFVSLVDALGGTRSADNVTKAPFYGVRGGYIGQSTSYLFSRAGSNGLYWSSTPYFNGYGNTAYDLEFRGSTAAYSVLSDDYVSTYAPTPTDDDIAPHYASSRSNGNSVRCVAR